MMRCERARASDERSNVAFGSAGAGEPIDGDGVGYGGAEGGIARRRVDERYIYMKRRW